MIRMETTQKPNYKKTLNLPRTAFSMKANLVQNEPASIKRWQQMKLYERIRDARKGSPKYSFHDGPPYANGSIHLGHLLNKVLKDIIVRWKTLRGLDCPYVPGWDCHGLPIEHKVMQELSDAARGDDEVMKVRRACKKYAEKFIKLQAGQMQRLLTLAEYDNPYLTMNPAYEGAVLDVFADLVGKDIVYRGLKPVHWSIANQTALAEAELEYEDREDTSVYVLFEVKDTNKLPKDMRIPAGNAVYFMIWTTTPWTLPANLAVAASPGAEYALYRTEHAGDKKFIIMADALVGKVFEAGGAQPLDLIARATGRDLADAGVTYTHPFIEDGQDRPVVTADYVTLEDGTGLVHTAPGHGTEDYQTGLKYGLDVYCPVKNDGTFDDTAPKWLQGVDVWKANDLVVEHLQASGHLFHHHKFMHSYPHDWRSKTPVIFRATEQWFVDVNKAFDVSHQATESPSHEGRSLKDRALDVTRDGVKFHPEWGRNRMRGMLESRPDWCLSRQRAWGLPIPAFYNNSGEVLLTRASVAAVAEFLRTRGSDAWFKASPEVILEGYDAANDDHAPDWAKSSFDAASLTKGQDIFDVWFESGSSWNAVIRRRFGDTWYPTDLYLEGSDQHRGWFQLSLLPALGVTGQAPFKHVLTHGFMVDKHGKKMSKSLGNALDVDELLKDYGSDVCRWWVYSLNTENDIKVDESYFKVAGEEYRKVRNTIRFLLSNLDDFDPAANRYDLTDKDATSIDAWALGELNTLIDTVKAAMENFHFRKGHEAMFNFCNEMMSAVYLAAVKDRLYCDVPDSPRRRRTQTAIHEIASALCRLLAPIVPHTADEAWRALLNDTEACVHLELSPKPLNVAVHDQWKNVVARRDDWLRSLESARQDKRIDNPLDIGLAVPRDANFTVFDQTDLADLCGISRFSWTDGDAVEVMDLREEPRCDRSWKRDGTVKQRSDGGMLSDRDAKAVGVT